MTIQSDITSLRAEIRLHELADDGYYLSLQYKEDCLRLYHLETALKEAEKNKE
jgi:hypothetical protein